MSERLSIPVENMGVVYYPGALDILDGLYMDIDEGHFAFMSLHFPKNKMIITDVINKGVAVFDLRDMDVDLIDLSNPPHSGIVSSLASQVVTSVEKLLDG